MTQPATAPFAALMLRILLIAAMALPMLVLYAVSTLGPLLSRSLQFKSEWLGYLVMSSFGLAAMLSLWAGAWVNRIGSRRALSVLFGAIALAFTLLAVAQHFYALAIAAAICGIAQALANPVTNLLIAERIQAPKRAGVVGLKQAGVQFAALFAGLTLPGIALTFGWRSAFASIVPAALLLLASVPAAVPRQPIGAAKAMAFSAPRPLLRRLMSVQFCVGIALSAFVTFLPSFAAQQGMPLPLAGMLIAVFGTMGIVSRIVLTPSAAKLKDESRLLLALILVAAGSMAVTMQTEPGSHWRLWVGAVGVGLTAVGTNAIAMSMLIRDKAFGPVATASGLVSVAFFGGFALGPPLYGALASFSGGLQLGWHTLIGMLTIGALMALALASARQRATRQAMPMRIERHATAEYRRRAAAMFALALPLLLLYALGAIGLLRSLDVAFKPELPCYLLLGAFGIAAFMSLLAAAVIDRMNRRSTVLALFAAGLSAVALLGDMPFGSRNTVFAPTFHVGIQATADK